MARQAIPRPRWARRVEGPGGGLRASWRRRGAHDRGRPGRLRHRPPFVRGGVAPPRGGRADRARAVLDDRGDAGAPARSCSSAGRLHLRANPGEIAFPGGRIEPGESPLAAAFREAGEEVALSDGVVEVLGELPIVLASRRFVPVLPFVAVAQAPAGARGEPARGRRGPRRGAQTTWWRRAGTGSEQWDRAEDPAWIDALFRPGRGPDLGRDGPDALRALRAPFQPRVRRANRWAARGANTTSIPMDHSSEVSTACCIGHELHGCGRVRVDEELPAGRGHGADRVPVGHGAQHGRHAGRRDEGVRDDREGEQDDEADALGRLRALGQDAEAGTTPRQRSS